MAHFVLHNILEMLPFTQCILLDPQKITFRYYIFLYGDNSTFSLHNETFRPPKYKVVTAKNLGRIALSLEVYVNNCRGNVLFYRPWSYFGSELFVQTVMYDDLKYGMQHKFLYD